MDDAVHVVRRRLVVRHAVLRDRIHVEPAREGRQQFVEQRVVARWYVPVDHRHPRSLAAADRRMWPVRTLPLHAAAVFRVSERPAAALASCWPPPSHVVDSGSVPFWPSATSSSRVISPGRCEDRRVARGQRPVPDPEAPLLTLDEPGIDEDLHVMADRRLRAPRRLDQVAGTDLVRATGRDVAQQPETDRVGERGERAGRAPSPALRRVHRCARARSTRSGRA